MIEAPNLYPDARIMVDALPGDIIDRLTPAQIDALADAYAHTLMRVWYDGQKAGISECINTLGQMRKLVLDRLG